MAYGVPPKVNPLRKFTDRFLKLYNASASRYAPPAPLDGGVSLGDAIFHPLLALPFPLKGILFGLFVAFVVSYATTRSSRQRLPPQPRRLPIIGNLLQLADRRWLYSRECKERFGKYRALT